jgi:hypothetical protein
VSRQRLLAAVCAVVFALSAGAAYAGASTYRGPMYWNCYCDGSSSYSTGWVENWFAKSSSGVSDTVVTLIDNGVYGYSWHGTVRNTAATQRALWLTWTVAKKGYCKFYSGTAFTGSCTVSS